MIKKEPGGPRSENQGLPSSEVPSAEFRPSLPGGRHRVARVGITVPVGVQVRRAVIQVTAHDHHVLPPTTIVPGDFELVPAEVERRVLPVVDGPDVPREEPAERQPLVGQRLWSADGRDADAPAVLAEVEGDPFDHRTVGGVAGEESQVFLVRVQTLPAPELRLEGAPDTDGVPLEGERHALVTLTPADAERAEGEAALGPLGGG